MDQKNHERSLDGLIEEVRDRRRQVFADHGNELGALLQAIQRRQAEHPEKFSDLRRRRLGKP